MPLKKTSLNRVIFTGIIEAEAESPRPDWAVISLTEPGSRIAKLKEGWHFVLRQKFHDIDAPMESCEMFNQDQAAEIINFVSAADSVGVRGILVHCRAGIGRSAAVAKWVALRYGIPFPESYSLYNRHVFRMLVEAFKNEM